MTRGWLGLMATAVLSAGCGVGAAHPSGSSGSASSRSTRGSERLLASPPTSFSSDPSFSPAPAANYATASVTARPSLSAAPVVGSGAATAGPAPFRPGKLLVGFRPGTSAAVIRRLSRTVSARRVHWLGLPGIRGPIESDYVLTTASPVLPAVRALRADTRWVRFAEPDYLEHASGVQNVPNDPSFPLQWGSLNTGQNVNGITGSPGFDDRASWAWGVSTGSRSIVIGEVDTGVDYNHPDLAANIWSNPGGIGGCPAGTHGYNVLASTCDPMDTDTSYGGHGTHVAGIMGAVGNNGSGVAGVNWHTTILPVKWLNSASSGYNSDLITGLQWLLQAKQAGVNIRVVNDSAVFVGWSFSQALSDEIDTLGSNGILFVTAAGNTGQNDDDPAYVRYPCGYDRPTEICVTAINQSGQLPSWANYGVNTVDMAAPGDNIYSTLRNGSYGYISGGSMAAAQVSGAAALILSVQDMSPTALKADITSNVDPLPSLQGLVRTGGTLDICKAMPGCSTVPPPPVNSTAPAISGSPVVGQTLTASPGTWTNSPTSYGYAWQRCSSTGQNCVAISGAATASYTVASADAGSTLEVTVTATNAGGSSSPTSSPLTAAVTTAPATATFGNETVGAGTDTFSADRKRVNAYTLSGSGSLAKLSVYLAPGSTTGTAQLEGIVYADSNGSPGQLLGTTAALSYASTQPAGWYDLSFATPLALSPGKYWIGVITGGTSGAAGFRYTSIASSRDYNSNTYSAGPSATFGSFSIDGEQMSLYGTYTPAATPPPADTSPPTISGSPVTGQTLTASSGSWTNSPTSYAYSWQRCDSSGSNCTATGTGGASYAVGGADVGYTLKVAVTAANAGGSSTPSDSAPTAVVAAAPTATTFGTVTVGSSTDTFLSNRKRVNAYAVDGAAAVSKLSIYLQPGNKSGTTDLEGVIYSNNNGAPAHLLGTTVQLAYSNTQAAGWYDLPFASAINLSAGTYWIGVITGGTSDAAGFRYTPVTSSRDYNPDTYSSGPTSVFGSFSTDGERMSLFATYQ